MTGSRARSASLGGHASIAPLVAALVALFAVPRQELRPARTCATCGQAVPIAQVAQPTGAEQLVAASAKLEFARSLEGRARLTQRLGAIDDLRAVRVLHPGDEASAGAAAVLAARELRALDLLDEATVELEFALALDADGPQASGWRLELADLERRRGEVAAAVASYAACAQDAGLDETDRAHARLWSGRLSLGLGRRDEGEKILIALAYDAADPVRSVQAFDELALSDVAAHDLGRAAGWIDACRRRHETTAARATPTGDRVRRALMRMRGLVELRCALFDQGPLESDEW